MKLYEVDREIEDVLARLEPDPETGEIPADEPELLAQLDALSMKREDLLRHLACLALNTKAAVRSLKDEETRLRDRRQRLERKQERLLSLLDSACGGRKTDLGVATLFYRSASHVELADPESAASWLMSHGYADCVRLPPPEISRLSVGRLLDAGVEIPGAQRVPTRSCYLK